MVHLVSTTCVILMVKQRIPAFSGTGQILQTDLSHNNDSIFETKEEFIAHLIRSGEIAKDTHHYQNDGFIYLQGSLKIDKRVKAGLNWNDVIVTSSVVENGQISRYQYLPLTRKGVKTELKPATLEEYMNHNNYGAATAIGGWSVKILRIPEAAVHIDFSKVRAQTTLFYGQSIALSKLPYSQNTLGLNPYSLGIDCPNPYEVAKEKGCGKEILDVLKPKKNIFSFFPLSGFIGFGSKRDG